MIYPPRWLDAPGTWSGGTMRANSIALGRLTSADVTRGMIGVPVRWRTAARSSRSCPDEWGVVTILGDGPTFVLDPTMNRPTLNTSVDEALEPARGQSVHRTVPQSREQQQPYTYACHTVPVYQGRCPAARPAEEETADRGLVPRFDRQAHTSPRGRTLAD